MQLYAILRRHAWQAPEDLGAAAERAGKAGNEDLPNDVRWIRSYVLSERAGDFGTVCIYEAASAEALQQHARLASIPADEVIPVMNTVVVRPDPT